jgi:O-antigen/teichoic acid export membrane protein
LLLVIVVTRILIGCMGPNLALLLGAERLKLEFVLTASALLLFLVLSVILGVLFGAIGVAFSTGGVMVLHELCRHVACRRIFKVRLPRGLWRLFLVFGISVVLTLWLKANFETTVLWLHIGVIGTVFSVIFWGNAQVMGIGPSLRKPVMGGK